MSAMHSHSTVSFVSSEHADDLHKKGHCCSVDPMTHNGRRNQRLQLTVIPMLPLLILTMQTVYYLTLHAQGAVVLQSLTNKVSTVRRVERLMTAIQKERRTMAMVFNLGLMRDTIRAMSLIEVLHETDDLAMTFITWPDDFHLTRNWTGTEDTSLDAILSHIRDDVIRYQDLRHYHEIIASYINWLPDDPIEKPHLANVLAKELHTLKELIKGQEFMELSYITAQKYFIGENLSIPERIWFVKNSSSAEDFLSLAILNDKVYTISKKYFNFQQDIITPYVEDLTLRMWTAEWNSTDSEDTYFYDFENFSNKHSKIRIEFLDFILNESIDELWKEVAGYIAFDVISFLLQIPIIIFIIHNTSNTNDCVFAMVLMFKSRSEELVKEKRKSELILCEMLPRSIVRQLKYGRTIHPEQYEAVTLCFVEIANYHDVSDQFEPVSVVTYLNRVFSFIDSKLELFDVYKVETVGAVYMVVSGLPIRNGDHHAMEIADLVLTLMAASTSSTSSWARGQGLGADSGRARQGMQLRVGVHSGPCCAGVVGLKCPRYCLFGDTVNTASRMQSNSTVGNIQISGATADRLREVGGYSIAHRGSIQVKGKGSMETYWLKGYSGGEAAKDRLRVLTAHQKYGD